MSNMIGRWVRFVQNNETFEGEIMERIEITTFSSDMYLVAMPAVNYSRQMKIVNPRDITHLLNIPQEQ